MKYYITTPIYYVNDTPHIGHAYTTIAADVIARWHRLKGDDVFFLTGTDEHGAKIAQAAAKAGITPQQLCDRNSAEFKAAWQDLSITYDDYIRTTEPRHEEAVKQFLQVLFDKGLIFKRKYEGLYCVPCEKYLSSQDLNEDMCCPDHKQKPVVHAEENYFFKLSQFRMQLLEILTDEKHPQHCAIYPVERRNEIVGKLKAMPLEDISISRSSLAWGIPLPFDPSQTAYVWVDALLNYITAPGYNASLPCQDNPERFRKYWPCDVHLMAKDILWFHSVIWPALLLGAGLPLPKRVFAHGFFTINGDKMSKTLGNVIHPKELIGKFGIDASRYLVLSLFPFGTDGDISWAALTEKYNVDLANNVGNLAARTLTMLEKYAEGRVPELQPAHGVKDIFPQIDEGLNSAEKHLEELDFYRFTGALQNAVTLANRYIEEHAPWKMAKEANPALPSVLYHLIANVKIITLFLTPLMPAVSAELWKQLGETEPVDAAARRYFSSKEKSLIAPRPGTMTAKGGILFPRILSK